MRRPVTRLTLTGAALLLVASIALPAAGADPVYREFTGQIQKVNKKEMIVDNRMGDKVKFAYSKKDTTVAGKKEDWKKLKSNDWVTVSWLFQDNPRKAYKVLVIDEKKEEGEDATGEVGDADAGGDDDE